MSLAKLGRDIKPRDRSERLSLENPMKLTIESSMRVTQSSLAFQIVGHEDGVYAYQLDPINEGGSIRFNSYSPNDEGGYSNCEESYTFRDGNWYKSTFYEGKDCDGYTSSENEYRLQEGGWVKLGRTRCRDSFAEAMGY